ncbi:hypothetical protein GCM10022402_28210 [Salinactinospora qingdaonensis]|uniref:Uncharacterized protein n=1 Tax=Salinactinospora qingdaonensis TaxID=702744 RepID=A0ABP7FSG3_9ACTN
MLGYLRMLPVASPQLGPHPRRIGDGSQARGLTETGLDAGTAPARRRRRQDGHNPPCRVPRTQISHPDRAHTAADTLERGAS